MYIKSANSIIKIIVLVQDFLVSPIKGKVTYLMPPEIISNINAFVLLLSIRNIIPINAKESAIKSLWPLIKPSKIIKGFVINIIAHRLFFLLNK